MAHTQLAHTARSAEGIWLRSFHVLITAKPAMYVRQCGLLVQWLHQQPIAQTNSPNRGETKTHPIAARICGSNRVRAPGPQPDEDNRPPSPSRHGMEEPGLDRLFCAAFRLLGLTDLLHCGRQEVRAQTMHIGDTAP